MGKLGSVSGTDGSAEPSSNTVFVDTSLDTHLAMIVFDTDSVFDLKEKMEKEHRLCFPHIGFIKVDALKVKRKGYYYHLSDSMFVKSAFDGVGKSWFLFADVSHSGSEYHPSDDPNPGNILVNCGINRKSLIDEVDVALDSCPKKLLCFHDSSLLLDGKECFVDENAPTVAECGSGNFSKGVLEMKNTEVKHPVDAGTDFGILDKYGPHGRENEGPKAHSTLTFSSVKEIGDVQCDVQLECTREALGSTKKKHRRKKRKEQLVNDHVLRDENHLKGGIVMERQCVIRENSLDNACKVSESMLTANKIIADKPSHNSSSDTHKKTSYGLQTTNTLYEENEILDEHVECINDTSKNEVYVQHINSLALSHSGPSSKKKRKIDQINGKTDSLKDNRVSVAEITLEQSSGNKQSVENAFDHLSTEPLEDAHPLEANLSNERKKRRKTKSSNHPIQAIAAKTSPGKDIKQGNSTATAGSNKENGSQIPDSTPLPSQGVQVATVSELSGISLKEKDADSVLGTGYVNHVFSDHPACKTDQTDRIADEIESVQKTDTNALLLEKLKPSSLHEGDVTIKEATVTPGKQKKTRKEKNLVGGRGTKVKSVTEGAIDSEHHNFSADLCKIGVDSYSGNKSNVDQNSSSLTVRETVASTSKRNMDDTNRASMETLLLTSKIQTGTESRDEKMRKKSKDIITDNNEASAEPTNLNSKHVVRRYQKDKEHQSAKDSHHVTVTKTSGKGAGNAMSHSEYKKSLLAKSGRIFKDASSGSSEDEDVVNNSDSSTRTPSDNSNLSDYSGGDSNASMNLSQNGSNGFERKDMGKRNIRKTGSSSPKNMNLDKILRSSSRYKKAKQTATVSQQLEETESQPVDFVPDSQPNL